MYNGDHITGEVKKLEFGMLTFKTDDMGTLQIKWDKISQVISKKYFEVELQDGRVYYGSLDTAFSKEQINITGYSETKNVFKKFVVKITPIKSTFWDILNGYVKLGFNYTKGSQVGQLNLGGNAKYRTKFYNTEATINSIITFKNQEQSARKQDLTLSLQRFLSHKWLVGGGVKLEQNTELGINLRSSVIAGVGYNIIQTNTDFLNTLLGLSFNRESFIDSTQSVFNLEGAAYIEYQLFIYDHPKASMTTSLNLFPGFTDWGRIRSNFDIQFDWEIILDLYWELSSYISYDNKPTGTSSSSDWGINTSFKYEL